MANSHANRLIRISFFLCCMVLFFLHTACSQNTEDSTRRQSTDLKTADTIKRYNYTIETPVCNERGCTGCYAGPEFVDVETAEKLGLTGTDIAHNYSNLMARHVGDQLKKMYTSGNYVKVDLNGIKMTTKGMDDGDEFVEYTIEIPFIPVSSRYEAMTSFDHCGGWGHPPALAERKTQLLGSPARIVKNSKLWISPLYKTPEGLEEYWIQWQHRDY